MTGRSCVMMGSLSSFSVREVLDVVALSRQHTVVELQREDGGGPPSCNLRGGHLVQGESDEQPRQALGIALRAPATCTFKVFRLDDSSTYRSYGQVEQLLTDEATMHNHPAAAEETPADHSQPVAVMPSAPPVFAPPTVPPAASQHPPAP